MQLPLPRFSWTEATANKLEMSNNFKQHHRAIPPPPVTFRRGTFQRLCEWPDKYTSTSLRDSISTQQAEVSAVNSDVQSTDSEVEQCESSCGGEESAAGISGHVKVSTNNTTKVTRKTLYSTIT